MSRLLYIFPALMLLGTCARAQEMTLREVQGNVEVQQSTWQVAVANTSISQAIRSGTGRAIVEIAQGQILMGSNSLMQVKNSEPNFVTGRYYLTGENHFFVNDVHYFTSGKVRVDSYDNMQRIAVIDGKMRVSSVSGILTVPSGKQYDIHQKHLSDFSETDPWYQSQYAGSGEARVEATSGKVSLQTDKGISNVIPVALLQEGQVLLTGTRSWAEVGFTGGGYLRLQPDSALSVASVEKTKRGGLSGREITLKLLKGSAWNVVAKSQGGYQINTPTVSTAVRGTVFRVDASGVVKVFDGVVALPSSGDMSLKVGQQLNQQQTVSALVPDASDLQNEHLDKERSQDIAFAVQLAPIQQSLKLWVKSQPTSRVTAQIQGATVQGATVQASQRLAFVNGASASSANAAPTQGFFYLSRFLKEGRYTVQIKAQRYDQQRTARREVIIDRHAPQLSGLSIKRTGQVLRLSGLVSDLSGQATLQLTVPGATPRQYTRILRLPSGPRSFDWVVPYSSSAATPPYHIQLSLSDPAGNTDHATY